MLPRCPFHRNALFIVAAFALLAIPARSQEKSPPDGVQKPKPKPAVTRKLITDRITGVKQSPALKDKPDEQKRVLALYEQAKTHLDRVDEFQKQLGGFQSLPKNVDRLTREQNRELAKPVADPEDDVSPETTFAQLEAKLAAARQELKAAQQALAALETTRKAQPTRRTKVKTRLAAAKKELAAVDSELSAKPVPQPATELARAQQTVQHAKRLELTAEIAALEAEIPTDNITTALLKLRLQVAGRRVQRAERAVKFWEKIVEERRGSEADQQQRAAAALLKQLRDNGLPKPLIVLAEENLGFAELRTGPTGLAERIRIATAAVHDRKARLKKLQDDRDKTKRKLEIPDIEDVIGPLLLDERKQLSNTGDYERSISKRRLELSDVRLKLLGIQEQARAYAKLEPSIQRTTDSLTESRRGADRDNLEQWVTVVLEQRKTLLASLDNDYDSLLKHLADLTITERQIVDATTDFRRLIDRHILWIRSTVPLAVADFNSAGEALSWAFSGEKWNGVWNSLLTSLSARPLVSTLVVFLLALMLLREGAMKRQLQDVGDRAAKRFTEPFLLTAQALGLTLLLAAQWAAVLWFLGWHLVTYSDSTSFDASVGTALQTVAVALFTLEFLRRMFRPRGLAAAHFRWRDSRLLTIRRNLRWFEVLALPAVFLFALVEDAGRESYITSLGRLLLMGLLMTGSAFLAIVLRKRGRPSKTGAAAASAKANHSGALTSRTSVQTAAYLCAIGAPLVLTGLAAAGYQYTATFLTEKLLQTVWLAVGLLVLHAMAVRWLYYARGRLALERTHAAQAAKAHAESPTPAVSVTGETPTANSAMAVEIKPPPATDMATINAQTRRLLKIAVVCGAVAGVWMIWADVIPALRFLDYRLGTTQVTLGTLLTAVVVIVVAFVAAGNIPGLLEVGVLKRLPIDSGARYAATAVARYSFYIVGIVTAFNLIGIGWDKVQWLVAALSVGLGFGLQEIVANWVSGIILLFERPLRVGDIVTVGDVSGVVTRIQIRATTIRNWDRKEYIVPNKELITGKLMNWTLSDQINRVVINVGVAYGTDTDQVRRLLQQIVAENSVVSTDPAPMVTFEGFGDSTLNFVIRCYLPSLENRLETVHQLHTDIHHRFAEAGIEIAFPQLDLHIRSDEAHDDGPLRAPIPATEKAPRARVDGR